MYHKVKSVIKRTKSFKQTSQDKLKDLPTRFANQMINFKTYILATKRLKISFYKTLVESKAPYFEKTEIR